MFEELLKAHTTELRVSGRQIEHRMNWAAFVQVDRLERALRTAKSRLQMLPTLSAKAN